MARSIVFLFAICLCGTQALAQEWRGKTHPDLAYAYERVYGTPERVFDDAGAIIERLDGVAIVGLRDYVTEVPGAPQPIVKAFAWIRGPIDVNRIALSEGTIGVKLDSIMTVRFPLSRLPEIASTNGIRFIELAQKVTHRALATDESMPSIGMDKVRNQLGLSGRGAIVGIIDSGIDLNHEDFKNPDGTTRILELWDQEMDSFTHSPPFPFQDGGRCMNFHIDANDCPSTDTDGHGTHVAGIAAGGGRASASGVDPFTYVGSAHRARLIIVRVLPDTEAVVHALSYIANQSANIYDRHWVANLSLGTHMGPHDGTSAFETAVSQIAVQHFVRGTIVVAAGNEGFNPQDAAANERNYIHATSTDSRTLAVNVNSQHIGETTESVIFQIWYDAFVDFSVRLTSPNGAVFGPYAPGAGNHVHGYPNGQQTGEGFVSIHNEKWAAAHPYPNTFDRLIAIELEDGNEPLNNGTWQIEMIRTGQFQEKWNAYIAETSPERGAYFSPGGHQAADNQYAISEPGNAQDVITVGSYNSKDCWYNAAGQLRCLTGYPKGEISHFSSPGPTRDERQKPDFYAPGAVIASSLSADASPEEADLVVEGGLHMVNAGTSMAAPHVAGVIAIMKQVANRATYTMTTNDYRNWLDQGAFFGQINAFNSVVASLKSDPIRYHVYDYCPSALAPCELSGTQIGKQIYILAGNYVTVNADLNMNRDDDVPTEIYNAGYLEIEGGVDVFCEEQAEIFTMPGGHTEIDGHLAMNCNNACFYVYPQGKLVFGEGVDQTLSGGAFLASEGGTIVVGKNASLHFQSSAKGPFISEGTTFILDQNASITSDRPVELIGTQANPIRFEPLGSDSWERVRLTGNNNHIEWVLFDGGKEQLDISGSSGNVITNSTFRNGFYGMRLTDVSSTVITNNHIHDNGNEGLLIFDTAGSDVEVSRNTIRNNGGPGIGLWNTNLYTFFDNVIEDNNSRGIEIMSGSYLFMNLDEPGQVEPGRNRVSENASHQIFISHSSTAYLAYSGLSSYHGYNSVFHTGGATTDRKYIYNLAVSGPGYDGVPYTIFAHRTFWNSYNPTSSLFTGPVDYSNFLVDDPTGGSGAPSGSTPTRIDTDQDLIDRPPPVVALITAGAAETVASVFGSEAAAQEALGMKQYIVTIRNKLREEPEDFRSARRLNALYYYQMLDHEDTLGEHYNMRVVYREWADRRGSVPPGLEAYQYVQLGVEAAMVIQVRMAIHERRLEEAEALLQEYSRYTHNLDHRVALMESGVAALGMRGYQAAALDLLDELRAVEPEEVVAAWYSPPNYDAVERLLRDQMAGGGNAEKFQVVLPVDGDDASAPLVFALEQNYPNPFNPSTTIPFNVAEAGFVRIEVFDVAGRLISVLVDERYAAGHHTVRFDGGTLASGVYIVRAVMSAADGAASRQFTRKVTLLK